MPIAPSKKNILYGKGIVYVAPLDDDYVAQGEIDFGECPMFQFDPSFDKDTIYSSRTGVKEVAFSAVIQRQLSGSFSTRDFNRETVNRFFLGDGFPAVSQGSGYETGESITVYALDRWYPLTKRDVSGVTVKSEDGLTTYVLNTDYKLRTPTDRLGMVQPLSSGSISEDDVIVVSYTYTAWAAIEVRPLTDVDTLCKIHFVGDPEYGPLLEANLWVAQVTCNSPLPAISEESATMEFTFETIADRDNHPVRPFGHIVVNEDWPT